LALTYETRGFQIGVFSSYMGLFMMSVSQFDGPDFNLALIYETRGFQTGEFSIHTGLFMMSISKFDDPSSHGG
jgi:hypothetical protein